VLVGSPRDSTDSDPVERRRSLRRQDQEPTLGPPDSAVSRYGRHRDSSKRSALFESVVAPFGTRSDVRDPTVTVAVKSLTIEDDEPHDTVVTPATVARSPPGDRPLPH
jgi:hypothetical protein